MKGHGEGRRIGQKEFCSKKLSAGAVGSLKARNVHGHFWAEDLAQDLCTLSYEQPGDSVGLA